MNITEKGKSVILSLLLAMEMAITGGCAMSGNHAQLETRHSDFSYIRKPSGGSDVLGQNREAITKDKDVPPMSSDELENSGDMYLTNGNLAMAFVNYEKALQLNARNLRIVYKKGLLLLSAGLYQDAEKVFAQLVDAEPHNALAHQGLGRTYFQMRRYEDAKTSLQRAVDVDPTLWTAYNLLGIIYDDRNEHQAALVEYRKAISLRPQEGMLYHNLGVCFSLQGMYSEAIEAFKVAVAKGYHKSRTYNCLGLSLSKLGRYQEAFQSFKTGGTLASAYNNLGFVYLNEGKQGSAIECFEKAMASNPEFYATASKNLEAARTNSSLVW